MWSRAQSFFKFQTLTPIKAKGYVEPVPVFRPLDQVLSNGVEVSTSTYWCLVSFEIKPTLVLTWKYGNRCKGVRVYHLFFPLILFKDMPAVGRRNEQNSSWRAPPGFSSPPTRSLYSGFLFAVFNRGFEDRISLKLTACALIGIVI